MKKESILFGIIGLLAGAIIAGFGATYAVNNDNTSMMRMMGMETKTDDQGMMSNRDMTMAEMSGSLENITGDDFDKAFLSGMIIHHQGAIAMARYAKDNAKHDEVKNLANNILSAQTKEIEMMQSWQKDWGYKTTTSTGTHDMSGMEH